MDDQSTHYVMRIDDRVKRKGLVTMQHVNMAVESLEDPGSRVHFQKLSTFCPRKLKVCSFKQWLKGNALGYSVCLKESESGK